MVIDGIKKNGIYFTYDFPQVSISHFDTYLNVKIDIQGEVFYNEKMTSNKVTINDLGNLLASYTNKAVLALDGLYKILPTNVNMTFSDQSGTVIIYPIKILFSRVRLTPPERLNTFISRYKKVDTSQSRKEYVTFLYLIDSYLKIKLEYKAGGKILSSAKTLSYVGFAQNTLMNQLVSVASVAKRFGVNNEDIIAYDVSLINDEIVTDKIRYVVDNSHYYCSFNMRYANAVGTWETFAFLGSNILDPEFSTQIYHVLSGRKQTSSKIKRYQTVNTGFLSAAKRQALEDLVISDEIYSDDFEGSQKKLIIEETDMKYTEHNAEANSATVKFYPAENHDRQLYRKVFVEQRIFDETFDITFN